MEKYNNWKLKFYTIWAGQAVSLITSAIRQMAIIFYLTEKTGSAKDALCAPSPYRHTLKPAFPDKTWHREYAFPLLLD